MTTYFYKLYVTLVCNLFTDPENEDFDDSDKDKDWKEKESSKISSERSTPKCDEISFNDVYEQGIINDIINKV